MALGKIKADTLEHSTAGSLDTSYVVNGSAKHWIRHSNGSSITSSLNNTSLTDSGTGTYIAVVASAFSNANYCVVMNAGGTDAAGGNATFESTETLTSNNVGHNVRDGTNSTNAGRQDATQTCVSCLGDLA